MRNIVLVLAGAAALTLSATAPSVAAPLGQGGNAIKDAADSMDLVEQAAYVVRGRRYCFYFDGWHGPGWYRCGFAFRRGLGWGGAYGWMGWDYGPARRRFGSGGFPDRGVTIREGGGVRGTIRGETSGGDRRGVGTTGSGEIREGTGGVRSTAPGGGAASGEVGRSPGGAGSGAAGSGAPSTGGTTGGATRAAPGGGGGSGAGQTGGSPTR